MKEIPEIDKDLVRWSRKRWLACVVLVLGVQVGGVYWGSQREDGNGTQKAGVPRVALMGELPSLLEGDLPLPDPMVLAEAHPKGFSGAAWLFPKPWRYSHDGPARTPDFVHYAQARSIIPTEPVSQKGWQLTDAPFFRSARSQVRLAQPATGPKSELIVQGGLAGRKLEAPVELPLQEASDVVENSVVQAGVNADGAVVSARLIERSRSKKADQDALRIARELRFEPEKGNAAELAWGKLIFQWFAVELAGTNAPPR